MKPEDLESIEGELFQTLDLADQQYIIGQHTIMSTIHVTLTPAGNDFGADFAIDWS